MKSKQKLFYNLALIIGLVVALLSFQNCSSGDVIVADQASNGPAPSPSPAAQNSQNALNSELAAFMNDFVDQKFNYFGIHVFFRNSQKMSIVLPSTLYQLPNGTYSTDAGKFTECLYDIVPADANSSEKANGPYSFKLQNAKVVSTIAYKMEYAVFQCNFHQMNHQMSFNRSASPSFSFGPAPVSPASPASHYMMSVNWKFELVK